MGLKTCQNTFSVFTFDLLNLIDNLPKHLSKSNLICIDAHKSDAAKLAMHLMRFTPLYVSPYSPQVSAEKVHSSLTLFVCKISLLICWFRLADLFLIRDMDT